MIEYVLVVWLIFGGVAVPGFEIGEYYNLQHCTAALASVETEDPQASFIAICVPRNK